MLATNILVSKNGDVAMCDFGCSTYCRVKVIYNFQKPFKYSSFPYTKNYCPLEVLLGCPYTKSIDYWSLG